MELVLSSRDIPALNKIHWSNCRVLLPIFHFLWTIWRRRRPNMAPLFSRNDSTLKDAWPWEKRNCVCWAPPGWVRAPAFALLTQWQWMLISPSSFFPSLLHRDFSVLMLQGSFFASCLVVTSSKSGHQGEVSPPCPWQTWPHLRPSQVLRFPGNQEELGVHPTQASVLCMSNHWSLWLLLPIFHTFPHSWVLSMSISMGKRHSGSGTKRGQPRAGIHQGVEILRICPWQIFQAGQGNSAPEICQIPG